MVAGWPRALVVVAAVGPGRSKEELHIGRV
jgi:hypothetical protein